MRAIDYNQLRSELAGSHPLTGPYSQDDAIAAEQLNAKNITDLSETRASERDILRVFGDPQQGHHALKKMEAAAENDELLARTLQWLRPTSSRGLDVANVSARAKLDQLVMNGVLTNAERDTIMSLAERRVSRASQLGMRPVKPGHVQKSRTVEYAD